MTHHAHQPTLRHQFAYVLSPARAWAGFGGLEVTVHAPPGWIAALTPTMTRTGDTFKGSYDRLPADAIALTVYAPLGTYRIVEAAGWILFTLVAIGGGLLVRRAARGITRRRAHDDKITLRSPLPPAVGLGALWAAAVLVSGWFATVSVEWAVPGQIDHRSALPQFLLLTMVAPVLTLGLGIWIALRASRSPAAPDALTATISAPP
jgi:hypothetical protein